MHDLSRFRMHFLYADSKDLNRPLPTEVLHVARALEIAKATQPGAQLQVLANHAHLGNELGVVGGVTPCRRSA